MTRLDSAATLDHGVLRFLTAGSVDDGKSTLIGRLLYDSHAILADQLASVERASQRRGQGLDLSLLTDGLTAEREQGITIDVAYRYFSTPARKFIVADAPGHVQYTRNMVTAASTASLAILLVDARNGIRNQTRRHATLAHLVGIEHLVLAVNKMDLVDYSKERFDSIVADFAAFARSTGIRAFEAVPISASEGDMVVDRGGSLPWYEGPTLLSLLEAVEVDAAPAQVGFRFPVQYVARSFEGRPRRYLGRVEAGSIAVGDDVVVLPGGRATRVQAIETAEGSLARAGLHASIGLVLEDDIDVARGDLIAHTASAPPLRRQLDADLCWLSERPLDAARTYTLQIATRRVRCRVTRLKGRWNVETLQYETSAGPLQVNDIARVTLALAEPVVADRYVEHRATGAFVLVDEHDHATVAAGMVRE